MERTMRSLVPKTAIRGRSQSPQDQLAKGLGYFSVVLGLAELLAPRAVCKVAGIQGLEVVVRAYGAREVATGVAILASHSPEPWIWGRVAGDMADMATIATGVQEDNPRRENSVLALAMIAALTIVDVICAGGLNAEKGNRKTAVSDYSKRSGFPKGVQAAHGVARRVKIQDDIKTQEIMRSHVPSPGSV
jgi:hypothetical protein